MNEADVEKCLKLIDDPVVKKLLIKTTEQAVDYGVSWLIDLFVNKLSISVWFCRLSALLQSLYTRPTAPNCFLVPIAFLL